MPKNSDKPHLGNKLLEAMAKKKVRQVDVADHFGVKPPTVSGDWIKHGRIGKKHFPKLVSYFGLPYEWWFGGAKEETDVDRGPALTHEQQRVLQLMGRMDQGSQDVLLKIASLLPVNDEVRIGGRRIGSERRQREQTKTPERRKVPLTNNGDT